MRREKIKVHAQALLNMALHDISATCRQTHVDSQPPQGLEVLRAQLGSGGQSAAALAFLANCVKDHGAVTAAVELFRNVSISPFLP